MSTPVAQEKLSRRQQIVQSYKMAKVSDPRLGLWILGAIVVVAAIAFGVFALLPGALWLDIVLAVLFGLMAGLVVFGRRVQRAAYRQMDGQRGGSIAALSMLKRGWRVDQTPIAFTKQQDVVFRVVGPPGIVLVGEGSPARIKQLLATEQRNHQRVVADTPIHMVVAGNGEGEVPLNKLVRHVTKLGRDVKPADMTDILNRLKALDATRSAIPLPKGPVPTSMKGMRGNLRGR
jgi:hypothetical protein